MARTSHSTAAAASTSTAPLRPETQRFTVCATDLIYLALGEGSRSNSSIAAAQPRQLRAEEQVDLTRPAGMYQQQLIQDERNASVHCLPQPFSCQQSCACGSGIRAWVIPPVRSSPSIRSQVERLRWPIGEAKGNVQPNGMEPADEQLIGPRAGAPGAAVCPRRRHRPAAWAGRPKAAFWANHQAHPGGAGELPQTRAEMKLNWI